MSPDSYLYNLENDLIYVIRQNNTGQDKKEFMFSYLCELLYLHVLGIN